MRLRGRLRLVLLVVCLGLLPARSEADLISVSLGNLGAGTQPLAGTFENDNDIALFAFHLDSSALVTVELTSFLCPDADGVCEDSTVRGFDPVLTLIAADTLDRLGDAASLTGDDPFQLQLPLGMGDYLLAITQFNNFYLGGGAFEYDSAPAFTELLFDPADDLPCDDFIAFTSTSECRNKSFTGTLTVELENVPEPGILALIVTGGAALAARRRRRRRDAS